MLNDAFSQGLTPIWRVCVPGRRLYPAWRATTILAGSWQLTWAALEKPRRTGQGGHGAGARRYVPCAQPLYAAAGLVSGVVAGRGR